MWFSQLKGHQRACVGFFRKPKRPEPTKVEISFAGRLEG
jgi:hypothetical protein